MLDVTARIVEGLLFASDRPLSLDEICDLTGSGPETVTGALERIQAALEEEGHAMILQEAAGSWRMVTDPGVGSSVAQLFEDRRPGRLSRAAVEALAVIAYNQPCTRAAIEAIRGVNCDSALKSLLERGLIRISGRQETPGRPLTYSTTDGFLNYFGLNDIDHLPRKREIEELIGSGGDGEGDAPSETDLFGS